MDTLKIGTLLQGVKRTYTIKGQLGHGGFGITYLAEAETMDVDGIPQIGKYCIKEFFLSGKCTRDESGKVIFSADAETVKNGKSDFKAEASALMNLNKEPGIVSVSEVIEANNTIYYVMAFLEGQTLEKMIQERLRLNEDEALPIIREVANSLDVLHKKKMTHLDVKPENIMIVNRQGKSQPVLIDFGLSRSYNMFGKESLGKRVFAVSDGYSPAEQYGILNGFTPQADIYALAATLLHALTGQMPPKADEISPEYVNNALIRCGISNNTRTAIGRAMQQDVNLRTKSVGQFLKDLERPGGGSETKEIDSNGNQLDKKTLRNILIASVALLTVFATYYYFAKGDDKTTPPDPVVVDPDPVQPDPTPPTPTPAPPVPEPAKTGSLKMAYSPSDVEVWIGGVKKGTATDVFNDLTAGSHEVELRKSGYESKTETVVIKAGEMTTVKGSLKKKEPEKTDVPTVTTTRTIAIGDYATWRGGVRSGKPHGQGTMTFTKDHLIDSYVEDEAQKGDVVEGTWEDGHLVNGIWKRGGTRIGTLAP